MTQCFFGISAYSGELFVLQKQNGRIEKTALYQIEPLKNCYTRSLRIIDQKLYIVSGPGRILQLCPEKLKSGNLRIEAEYPVPFELSIMNDMIYVEGNYYITSYQDGQGRIVPKLVRVKQLEDLEQNRYEDLYEKMGLKGVPYYFSLIGDRIYLTEIDHYSRILSFRIEKHQIEGIQIHFDFGPPVESSKQRREQGEQQCQ